MKTPETSRLFTKWRNPANGVESFILTERPASVQKSFYFTNRSFTADGRYFWVTCKFVPKGGMDAAQIMGVVDFERDEFRVHHDIQPSNSSAMVDEQNGDLYWFHDYNLWKRGPGPDDEPQIINTIPKDLCGRKKPERVVTHLSFSADRKSMNLDVIFDKGFVKEVHIGDIPLDGSPTRIWQKFEGNYDHGLFSPTDPDLILFAHEYWQDHVDDPFDHALPYHRLWMIRRGEKARPILRTPVSHSGHEWWDPDGKHVWYVHYGVAVKKVDIATGTEVSYWDGALSHAYSDHAGRYLVADIMDDPVVSDCHVAFRDTVTGKEVELVNKPPLAKGVTQCVHLHPHPQFCQKDNYICYTTTVHNRVDIALTPTADLIARTR